MTQGRRREIHTPSGIKHFKAYVSTTLSEPLDGFQVLVYRQIGRVSCIV